MSLNVTVASQFVVDSVNDLRTTNVARIAQTDFVYLRGYNAPGDGGGGFLYLDVANPSGADDGFRRFQDANGVAWSRQTLDHRVPIYWFGPWNPTITDWSPVVEAAATTLLASDLAGHTLVLPEVPWTSTYAYPVETTMDLPPNLNFAAEDTIAMSINAPTLPVVIYGFVSGDPEAITVTRNIHFKHISRANRGILQAGGDPALNVGLIMYDAHNCHIRLEHITRSLTCFSPRSRYVGFAYNKIDVGNFFDALISVDFVTEPSQNNVGWLNQNTFTGGRFSPEDTSSFNAALAGRTPIIWRFRHNSAFTSLSVNTNRFYDQSYEAVPTYNIVYDDHPTASRNYWYAQRVENTGAKMIESGPSASNVSSQIFEATYLTSAGGIGDVTHDPKNLVSGTRGSPIVIPEQWAVLSGVKNTSTHWQSVRFHEKATQYDTAQRIFIPGVFWRYAGTGTTNYFASDITGVIIGSDYIEIPETSNMGLAFAMDLRYAKQVIVCWNVPLNPRGRNQIRCFNAAGAILSGSSPLYAYWAGNQSVGNYYVDGTATSANKIISFHDDVASAIISHVPHTTGTGASRYHSVSVKTVGLKNAPVYNVFSEDDGFTRYATAAPTAKGTYNRGQVLVNHAPTATGDPVGWQCLTSGTPGTWRTLVQ